VAFTITKVVILGSACEVAQKRRDTREVPEIKRGSSLPLAIIVVAAVLVTALLVVLSQMSGDDEEAQERLAGVPQDGTTLGAEDAPVTIYLYEDLQCPACARFTRETFPDLVTRYVEPGEVRIVSETLAILGPDSVPAAEAALAAGEQDRYWEYSTLFFLDQGRENSGYVTDEFLTSIAEETQGLDVGQWNETREYGSGESELDAAQSRARDQGVEATPTLVVSGTGGERMLRGAVPTEEVAAAIDEVRAA
jgi:protein-disulfide isomerase